MLFNRTVLPRQIVIENLVVDFPAERISHFIIFAELDVCYHRLAIFGHLSVLDLQQPVGKIVNSRYGVAIGVI